MSTPITGDYPRAYVPSPITIPKHSNTLFYVLTSISIGLSLMALVVTSILLYKHLTSTPKIQPRPEENEIKKWVKEANEELITQLIHPNQKIAQSKHSPLLVNSGAPEKLQSP